MRFQGRTVPLDKHLSTIVTDAAISVRTSLLIRDDTVGEMLPDLTLGDPDFGGGGRLLAAGVSTSPHASAPLSLVLSAQAHSCVTGTKSDYNLR